MTATNQKQWQLKALTEALGDLTLTVEDTLSVGRGKDNDVVLGSKQVSRQHAELNVLNGELFIKDLGSSNGTLVNDVKIEAHKSKHLKPSDTVSFAIFNFAVTQAASESLSAPTLLSEPTQNAPVSETGTQPTSQAHPTSQEQPIPNEDTISEQERYPMKTEDVDTITEAKLKEELEAPIPMGDPSQDNPHQAPTQPANKPEGTVHTRQDDETSAKHFKELAEEADPDVLRAKQAAAAKFSGTVDVNHDEPQSTLNPEQAPSTINPVGDAHPNANTNANNITPIAPAQPTSATSGGSGKWMMIILVIIIIVIAIWLFSNGASA